MNIDIMFILFELIPSKIWDKISNVLNVLLWFA